MKKNNANNQVKVNTYKYEASFIDAATILDSDMASIIDALSKLDKTDEGKKARSSFLTQLKKLSQSKVNMPVIQDNHSSLKITLCQSIMADLLNVEHDAATDKIIVLHHATVFSGGFVTGKILKQLQHDFLYRIVRYGVVLNGVPYTFYTASPGQLKKGSMYLIRSDEFKRLTPQIWGGRNPANIKKMLVSKQLQYRALLLSSAARSANVLPKPMKLRNAIVVKDVTVKIPCNCLSLSQAYEAAEKEMLANNMPWDGMIFLEEEVWGHLVAQVRGYGIKGLAVSVGIKKWCQSRGYNYPFIEDVCGVTHNVEQEGISIFLTESTVKTLGDYKSFDEMRQACEMLGMDELYICAVDEEETENKTLSRQMLQTLIDITDEELYNLCRLIRDKLLALNGYEGAFRALAELDTPEKCRSNFAKFIAAYPDAICHPCVRKALADRYRAMYADMMIGRVEIKGNYKFVVTDPIAWVDIAFGGKDPQDATAGLLGANECYLKGCTTQKVCLLRSPHAFMEWATATVKETEEIQEYFTGNVVYCSMRDMICRILQYDVDGDHLLVIQDEKLVEIAERTRAKYDIPVLYYEPTNADKIPMPATKDEMSALIVECIMSSQENNLVGPYSNLATAAFSMIQPGMAIEEVKKLLVEIAIIACGINHAVDAQKTGKLIKLPDEVKDTYGFKTYSERFKSNGDEHPYFDSKFWDSMTAKRGLGVIDRNISINELVVPSELRLELPDDVRFDYKLMLFSDPLYNVALRKVELSEEFARDLADFNAEIEGKTSISFLEMTAALYRANAAFWKKYNAVESDLVLKSATSRDRIRIARKMLVGYLQTMVQADPEKYAAFVNADDKKLLKLASYALDRAAFSGKETCAGLNSVSMPGFQKYILDILGDVYAEAVKENNNYVDPAECPITDADIMEEIPAII